jgi:hypothetical protein
MQIKPFGIIKKINKSKKHDASMNLYTLEVFLISGPVTHKFGKKNPIISRTIEIRGNQTLEDLHHAIFKAFDREDEHMYEFQFGGKGPNDPRARRFGLSAPFEGGIEQVELEGDVTQIRLDALKLKKDEIFGYWFDFGDDWWHQTNVLSIEKKTPKGEYPKVSKRIGQSPPQYIDADE